MRFIFFSLFMSFVLFSTGCVKDKCTEPEMIDTTVRFSQIQTQIFDDNCASSGCHGGANPQANLNLESGQSYQNLVNVTSILNPSLKRVLPDSSSRSYLIKVLSYNDFVQMPPGGKLDDETINRIARWIDDGALNN